MDAFFNGLDCRLRVSGMVADSIMMGIVNSAMEDAYKRSCSKEGDIERLIQKSRFCELAIMQLEWCLKYLQEEIDNTTCDREILLCDLLETRNRIHYRLEETNMAIAERDAELVRRKESEMKLKLALELKGEEVRSLHSTLGGLEREKNENESSSDMSYVNEDESDHHVLDEVGCSVDKQLSKVRNKLQNGRQILTSLMHSTRSNPNTPKANSGDFFDMDSDGIKTLHELHELMLDIDEIVTDVDILKNDVRSSLETISSSVSLFKASTEEDKWTWNMEREITSLVVSNILNADLSSDVGITEKPKDYELHEEIRRLKEEKDAMEIKAVIVDDVYEVNYRGLVRTVRDHFSDINSELLIRESIFRVIFIELVNEMINMRESYINEQYLKEQIYNAVFTEVIKGIEIISLMDHMEDKKVLINPALEEGLDHSLNSDMKQHNTSCNSTRVVRKNRAHFDLMEKSSEKFSQMMEKFELATCDKLSINILRYVFHTT
ncbi:hypothetical protein Cni_G16836 [Canna indica]|uniref:WPP domain-associated protein n=1 Tax=Canna indica TaxID=4628 RepID=A0AAQ3QEJ9_9LILI|nr:hypothetical protein Cni_G16836 [Canna indica]